MYSGDSLKVETSVNSFEIGNTGSLRGCQRQSQTGAMYSGGSLEVEISVKSFGIGNPGSLRWCQIQSQTGLVYSGGSLEVETSLVFWHRGSWKSARVSKTVADRCNVHGRGPRGRN